MLKDELLLHADVDGSDILDEIVKRSTSETGAVNADKDAREIEKALSKLQTQLAFLETQALEQVKPLLGQAQELRQVDSRSGVDFAETRRHFRSVDALASRAAQSLSVFGSDVKALGQRGEALGAGFDTVVRLAALQLSGNKLYLEEHPAELLAFLDGQPASVRGLSVDDVSALTQRSDGERALLTQLVAFVAHVRAHVSHASPRVSSTLALLEEHAVAAQQTLCDEISSLMRGPRPDPLALSKALNELCELQASRACKLYVSLACERLGVSTVLADRARQVRHVMCTAGEQALRVFPAAQRRGVVQALALELFRCLLAESLQQELRDIEDDEKRLRRHAALRKEGTTETEVLWGEGDDEDYLSDSEESERELPRRHCVRLAMRRVQCIDSTAKAARTLVAQTTLLLREVEGESEEEPPLTLDVAALSDAVLGTHRRLYLRAQGIALRSQVKATCENVLFHAESPLRKRDFVQTTLATRKRSDADEEEEETRIGCSYVCGDDSRGAADFATQTLREDVLQAEALGDRVVSALENSAVVLDAAAATAHDTRETTERASSFARATAAVAGVAPLSAAGATEVAQLFVAVIDALYRHYFAPLLAVAQSEQCTLHPKAQTGAAKLKRLLKSKKHAERLPNLSFFPLAAGLTANANCVHTFTRTRVLPLVREVVEAELKIRRHCERFVKLKVGSVLQQGLRQSATAVVSFVDAALSALPASAYDVDSDSGVMDDTSDGDDNRFVCAHVCSILEHLVAHSEAAFRDSVPSEVQTLAKFVGDSLFFSLLRIIAKFQPVGSSQRATCVPLRRMKVSSIGALKLLRDVQQYSKAAESLKDARVSAQFTALSEACNVLAVPTASVPMLLRAPAPASAEQLLVIKLAQCRADSDESGLEPQLTGMEERVIAFAKTLQAEQAASP